MAWKTRQVRPTAHRLLIYREIQGVSVRIVRVRVLPRLQLPGGGVQIRQSLLHLGLVHCLIGLSLMACAQ
jgi:hypothetical protein